MKKILAVIILMTITVLAQGQWNSCEALSKVADLCDVFGQDYNVIQGEGLVVGLKGTGDKSKQTAMALAHYIVSSGMQVDVETIKPKNVALVHIIAKVAPYSKKGHFFDVKVSSIGDATSLENGTLIMTPMFGPHRWANNSGVYAIASGSVLTEPNSPVVGTINAGGQLMEDMPVSFCDKDKKIITLILKNPDWRTANDMAQEINAELAQEEDIEEGETEQIAHAISAGIIEVTIPEKKRTKPGEIVAFMARVLDVRTTATEKATVYINTRRAGGVVAISSSVTVTDTVISLTGSNGAIQLQIVRSQDLQNLIAIFNTMKLSTQDIIDVLRALKKVGALKAEIVIDDERD